MNWIKENLKKTIVGFLVATGLLGVAFAAKPEPTLTNELDIVWAIEKYQDEEFVKTGKYPKLEKGKTLEDTKIGDISFTFKTNTYITNKGEKGYVILTEERTDTEIIQRSYGYGVLADFHTWEPRVVETLPEIIATST